MGDGVRASGDSGMFPADLRRGERYWRCSLGARPCSELGRMWPEPAGELGTLEPGELLWDEVPPSEWAESGVERQPCVGLRGDRACVGEPAPLSPDDSERLSEDRLRLVWSSDACLVIFLKRDVLFLLAGRRHVQGPHAAHVHVHVHAPPCSPVRSLFGLRLLAASRHFGLVARLPGGADLDGRVLERRGRDGHFGAALEDPQRPSSRPAAPAGGGAAAFGELTFRISSTTSV